MENTCLNCGNTITENFCANCGQKKFKRIDKKYLIDEIQYSVVHTNKGFFYTLKSLLKNPGKTAREFIDGNRVNHYKPIGLTLILSGISTFISFKVLNLKEIMIKVFESQNNHKQGEIMNDWMTAMSSYNSLLMLFLIPFFAGISYLVFRKWGQNYYEHIIMNAFFQSFYSLTYMIVFYPILYLLRDNISMFGLVTMLSSLVIPVLLFWFFKGFYSEKSIIEIVARVIIMLIIMVIIYFILIIAFVVYIYATEGVEGFKNFAPKPTAK